MIVSCSSEHVPDVRGNVDRRREPGPSPVPAPVRLCLPQEGPGRDRLFTTEGGALLKLYRVWKAPWGVWFRGSEWSLSCCVQSEFPGATDAALSRAATST